MTIGVYAFFDKRDDTCLYVGQSITVEYRIKRHFLNFKSRKALSSFQRWIDENSTDNLNFKILIECSKKELNRYELHFFEELSPKFFGSVPSLLIDYTMSDDRKRNISNGLNKFHEANSHEIYLEDVIKYAADEDFSISEAAEELGLTLGQLKIYLKKKSISWVRKKRDVTRRIDEAPILDMYFKERLTTWKIAEIVGCSQPAIVLKMRELLKNDPRSALIREGSKLSAESQNIALIHTDSHVNIINIDCSLCVVDLPEAA